MSHLWASVAHESARSTPATSGRNRGLAGRFAERLGDADGVEVLNQVVLNQVLVRFLAADGDHDAHTRRVVERTQQDGTCWMSGTTWQGKAAMRISVSNWSTTEEDVDRLVAALSRAPALRQDGGGSSET